MNAETDQPDDNKRLVREVFGAWARGDIGPFVNAMADDVRWVFPGSWSWSGVCEPKQAVVQDLLRGAVGSQLQAGFGNHASLILADEDRVVVQAQGRGRTLKGDRYDNTYCFIFRLRKGQIVEVIEHCDTSLVDRVLAPPPVDLLS